MKNNGWMILSVALLAVALGARADGQLDAAPSAPAPTKKAKPAPAAKPVAAAAEKPVILSPGAATVVGKNINVRGKAGFNGEVIAKLQNGDAVTVIEQIILSKPKKGEPSQWAKIGFPASTHVWVHNSYLNADKTVKPKKLNVRTGAGENYSVVGTLEQGTPVKEISTKGNWTEIEAPASAFAFVAATFVQQDATVADTVPQVVSIQAPDAAPEATPTAVTSDPLWWVTPRMLPIRTRRQNRVPTRDSGYGRRRAPPAVLEEVWVPRTVSHEGIVKPTVSIQAPTKFGLHSKENGKLINYLYSPTRQLEMSRMWGAHHRERAGRPR
jgi:uncharacterized protein YgiM (DUF1202 family)